jgi:hypothetical protein
MSRFRFGSAALKVIAEVDMSKLTILAVVVGLTVTADAEPLVESTPAEYAKDDNNSDFPFVIKFERGAIQFNGGDNITIEEVRCTSKDLESGICRIAGSYTLASEDSATLAASVTANNANNGKGPWNSAQRTEIAKGSGKFKLYLPISVKGWPHISFYSKSNSFGGVYFGTGDSVLRRWWGPATTTAQSATPYSAPSLVPSGTYVPTSQVLVEPIE